MFFKLSGWSRPDGRQGQGNSPLPVRVLVLSALALCSACATLPTSGPTASAITDGAKSGNSSIPYEIVTITPEVAARGNATPGTGGLVQLSSFASSIPPMVSDTVRVGDTLNVSVFEVGVSLFAPLTATASLPEQAAPTANRQQFPVRVDENGDVNLPYIGAVKAAGFTTQELAQVVRAKLRKYSESPSVIINITDTIENTVYIAGEIGRPGRYTLSAGHERLLDLVALAGGARGNPNDAAVRFVREDRAATVRLSDLTTESDANLTLLPGDRVTLVAEPRTFTVFGAVSQVAEVPFTTQNVTLAQALARVAGPNDARANPRGVFLFRLEPGGPDGKPLAVVYQLNMLKPEAYFLAQMFQVRDDDVLLVSNSRSNMTTKLIGLINQLFSPIFATTALIDATTN